MPRWAGRRCGSATRRAPARGRIIDVDLVDTVFSLMEGMLPEYGLFGWVRQPQGAAIPTAAPTNTYPAPTASGSASPAIPDLIFRRLMAAIGREELARRSALRHQRAALRERRRDRCGDRRLDADAAGGGGRGDPRGRRGAVLPPVRHARLRRGPAFPRPRPVMQVDDPLLGPVLHPAGAFRFDGVAPREMVRWTAPLGRTTTRYLEFRRRNDAHDRTGRDSARSRRATGCNPSAPSCRPRPRSRWCARPTRPGCGGWRWAASSRPAPSRRWPIPVRCCRRPSNWPASNARCWCRTAAASRRR